MPEVCGLRALGVGARWDGQVGAGGVLGVAIIALVGSRKLRDAAVGLALMQAAIVRATMNAVRGEWDVWHR